MIRTNLKGIMAIGFNNIIARPDGSLPWKNTSDMNYFRKITMTKDDEEYTDTPIVIMGRKTYVSIGNLLQDRYNVIITKPENYQSTLDKINKENPYMSHNFKVITNIDEAIDFIDEHDTAHISVIGGPNILEQFLPYISELHITHIAKDDCIYEEGSIYIDDSLLYKIKYMFNFKDISTDKLIISLGRYITVAELKYRKDNTIKILSNNQIEKIENILETWMAANPDKDKYRDFFMRHISDIYKYTLTSNKITLLLNDYEIPNNINKLYGYETLNKIVGQYQPLFKIVTMSSHIFDTYTLIAGFDVEVIRGKKIGEDMEELLLSDVIRKKHIRSHTNVERILRSGALEFKKI